MTSNSRSGAAKVPVPEFVDHRDTETGIARPVRLSYSTSDQPAFRQAVIRAVEFFGGQRRLLRLYREQADHRRPGETFFDAAVRLLALDVRFDAQALSAIPRAGPVLFVANHPYGVLDGIVLTWIALKARPEFQVMANGVLTRAPEAREFLLPVDFSGTAEARTVNLASRRTAGAALRAGKAIGIFPGGGVATSERPLSRPALDLPWAPFAAKLIRQARPTVVPVHFSGQNSRLFQIASHYSETMRLSLLFRETTRRIGTRLDVQIGAPLSPAVFDGCKTRADCIAELRRRTYALCPIKDVDWMRHGRIRQPGKTRRGATAKAA